MTQPRMLLGGAALALLLAGCCIIQSCRKATVPSAVVVTRLPPLDPPQVTPLAAVGPARQPANSGGAGPKAVPAAVTTPSEAAAIMVHVVGAVKKPGVYPLPAKARLMDAVHAAGGAKAGADLEAVNLAGFVQDGEQIRVPALSERSLPRLAAGAPSRSPQLPRIAGPARPVRSTARYPLSEATAVATAGSSPPEHGTAAKKMTGVVNLNSAGAAELATLPGVGPKTAEAILAYRQEHGSFQRVEDLLEIRGIGEKKLARMRDWVAVK
jgi:competence protein ComEA